MVRYQGHYHVDIITGKNRKCINGLVLCLFTSEKTVHPLYRILDEYGVLRERGEWLSEPLTLEVALAKALALMRSKYPPPIYPAWLNAPYKMLGYQAPKIGWKPWHGFLPLPVWISTQEIGIDGLPTFAETSKQ